MYDDPKWERRSAVQEYVDSEVDKILEKRVMSGALEPSDRDMLLSYMQSERYADITDRLRRIEKALLMIE